MPFKSSARVRTLDWTYADACIRGYYDFLMLDREAAKFGDIEYHKDLEELKRKRDIAGLQVIVFAAMCFEAAIYDFAAIHLTDGYVQKYLDKLDVLSKWVVILKLVTGYELRADRSPYASLKQLVKARNRLVHSKSEEMDFDNLESQIKRLQEESNEHERDIHNAFRALVLMSLELEHSLGPNGNPLLSFDPDTAPGRQLPNELQEVVDRCRQIVTRDSRENQKC